MIKALKVLYILVFLGILYGTVTATLERGLVTAVKDLWPDAWFRATLIDCYFGFLTISLWVIYKENHFVRGLLWTLGVMILGNFAIAAYLLIQLNRLQPGDPLSKLLVRADEGGK